MEERNCCRGWVLGTSLALKSNSGFDVLFAHSDSASLSASRNGRARKTQEEGLGLNSSWELGASGKC